VDRRPHSRRARLDADRRNDRVGVGALVVVVLVDCLGTGVVVVVVVVVPVVAVVVIVVELVVVGDALATVELGGDSPD
jgi:Flp pilus assembly protein TadB